MILEGTVARIDLKGRGHNNVRHFILIGDDDKKTYIRIGHNSEPVTQELERVFSEVQANLGLLVKVEVQPIEWAIGSRSGTSHKFCRFL